MDTALKQHIKGVIMAGGSGTRFWPKSRKALPKQFLNILGDKSMLQMTMMRLLPLTGKQNITIVGNKEHASLLAQQAKDIANVSLILEPVGRNTAACIATAAFLLLQKDPESILVILPADHWITDDREFTDTLLQAARIAHETGGIITIGIPPAFPATGYGYIRVNAGSGGVKVEAFVEKPDVKTAKSYLASGDYFWNSGIFVCKTSAILREIETHLPELYFPLKALSTCKTKETIIEFIDRVYPSLPDISIDFGVMEKTDKAYLVKAEFGWSDVGSWDALYTLSKKNAQGNVSKGPVLLEDCSGCFVDSSGRLLAGVGLEDLIIIDTDDAALIVPRGRSQDVRDIVQRLRDEARKEVL
jgi:mannose-1-phosphate guanylyltransferase